MAFIVVYVTHPDKECAEKIGNHLLENKLIACSNIFPITSSCFWENNMENTAEFVTILKTKKEKWNEIQKEILSIHPYKTPCIMKFEVEANKGFEDWINNEVK